MFVSKAVLFENNFIVIMLANFFFNFIESEEYCFIFFQFQEFHTIHICCLISGIRGSIMFLSLHVQVTQLYLFINRSTLSHTARLGFERYYHLINNSSTDVHVFNIYLSWMTKKSVSLVWAAIFHHEIAVVLQTINRFVCHHACQSLESDFVDDQGSPLRSVVPQIRVLT